MATINRLTNKPDPTGSDLIPIWDSQSGRTRNATIQSVIDLADTGGVFVVSIAFVSPNLIVTKSDGSQQVIDITII